MQLHICQSVSFQERQTLEFRYGADGPTFMFEEKKCISCISCKFYADLTNSESTNFTAIPNWNKN